jgi:hypothetical protein
MVPGKLAATILLMLASAALFGAKSAVAGPTDSSSLARDYTAMIRFPKIGHGSEPLTLRRDGSFSFGGQDPPSGTWNEVANLVTLTAQGKLTGLVFTVDQKGMNLGSKSHQGEVISQGHQIGTWYALAT